VEIGNPVEYTYDTDGLAAALAALGFSENGIALAQQGIAENAPTRTLRIVQIGTNEYQAIIEISFTPTADGGKKVIEFIPKEFAASAAKIFSSFEFKILNNDPVIEFIATGTQGATTKLIYGISGLTQQEAAALTENNVLQEFSAPPIIVSPEKSFADLTNGWIIAAILWGAAILVIIVIILLAVFFVSRGGRGKGFSGMSNAKRESKDQKWAHKEN